MEDGDEENYMYNSFIDAVTVAAQADSVNNDSVRPGGSVEGRTTIARDYAGGYTTLLNDYFVEGSVFETKFHRRYRMRKSLFLRITEAMVENDDYFVQKENAAKTMGLHPIQKCTAAMRMLSNGASADSLDEYLGMGESTVLESLVRFCKGVCKVFGKEYLRRPTPNDVERLYREGEERGFPGMLGSIDCMHWTWKNCPTAHHGQYRSGDKKVPTLILEAVASKDLWIWHAFFGLAGTLNDINVLDPYTHGVSHNPEFFVNGESYTMGYYLTDGIYPKYANLVSAKKIPITGKEKVKLATMK